MKPILGFLTEAEERGFLAVESEHRGMQYIFDPERREVAILAVRPREKVILPLSAVRELYEAMEVLCG
jgi:hypothetical protein